MPPYYDKMIVGTTFLVLLVFSIIVISQEKHYLQSLLVSELNQRDAGFSLAAAGNTNHRGMILSDYPQPQPQLLRQSQQQQQQQEEQQQEEEHVHVVILSNRYLGLATTLGSLCSSLDDTISHYAKNSKLVFHIFTETLDTLRDPLTEYLQSACPKSTIVHFLSVEDVMDNLASQGFQLKWKNLPPKDVMDEPWTVETPFVSETHYSPMNLLRFYLPYIESLRNVHKVIHLDDDMILQKDIRALWRYQLSHSSAVVTDAFASASASATTTNHNDAITTTSMPLPFIAAACHHWSFQNGHYVSSNNLTLQETMTIGKTSQICNDNDTPPTTSKNNNNNPKLNCVRSNLQRDLAKLSKLYSSNDKSPYVEQPWNRRAFNFGMSLIDLQEWQHQQMTQNYENAVELSFALKLFRPNSLAFGLGLPIVVFGDSFQCYDDDSNIRMVAGLSFINAEQLHDAGWSMSKLVHKASVLHYNGQNKPWSKELPSCHSDLSIEHADSPTKLWQTKCIHLGLCSCQQVEQDQQKGQNEGSLSSASSSQTVLLSLPGSNNMAVTPSVTTTSTSTVSTHKQEQQQQEQQEQQQNRLPPLLVFTEARSGSDWFMDKISETIPEICSNPQGCYMCPPELFNIGVGKEGDTCFFRRYFETALQLGHANKTWHAKKHGAEIFQSYYHELFRGMIDPTATLSSTTANTMAPYSNITLIGKRGKLKTTKSIQAYKLFHDQFVIYNKKFGIDPHSIYDLIQKTNTRVVVLYRKNKFEQIVSELLALQTGVWHRDTKKSQTWENVEYEKIHVNTKELIETIQFKHEAFHNLTTALEEFRIRHKIVIYEDCVANPKQCWCDVANVVGVPCRDDLAENNESHYIKSTFSKLDKIANANDVVSALQTNGFGDMVVIPQTNDNTQSNDNSNDNTQSNDNNNDNTQSNDISNDNDNSNDSNNDNDNSNDSNNDTQETDTTTRRLRHR